MNIYVNEKDIDTIEGLFDATHCYDCWECNRNDNLKIVPLDNYAKQIRKKVVQEIESKLDSSFLHTDLTCSQYVALRDILNQTKRSKS